MTLPSYLLAVAICTEILPEFIVTSHILPEKMLVAHWPYFPTFRIPSTCSIQVASDTTLLPMNQSVSCGNGLITQKTRNREAFLRMALNTVSLVTDATLYTRSPGLILHKLTVQYCILMEGRAYLGQVFLSPNNNTDKNDRRNTMR